MKKSYLLTLLMVLLCWSTTTAFAQRMITGTVTDGNEPLVGAAVKPVGGTGGSVTDIDGNYSIKVGNDVKSLTFSYTGYTTQTVQLGTSSVLDVTLQEDSQTLGEVVVTALGISREQKSLPYASQQVNVENASKVRTDNFVNNLQGKVAGAQVYSGSNMGGSSRIIIRGIGSLTGDNQPLFVVDGVILGNQNFNTADQARGGGGFDYGNGIGDLNPDDVASVNILKGGAATALYGQRAANGAVIITTKKGTSRKGVGIQVNSGISWENVSLFPDYQNTYGGGTINGDDPSGTGFTTVDELGGQLVPDYGTDESWGPKFEGQLYRPWNSFDEWDTENYGKLKPWQASTSDVKDFFDTGLTYNNSVALAGGNDLGAFRLSYANVDTKGIMPNSSLKRNTVSFSGDLNLTKRLNVSAGINYIRTGVVGRYDTGYSDGLLSNFNQWWHRDLNFTDLQSYKNPDGSQRSWNRGGWDDGAPLYWNNPYWTRYENYTNDSKDRYFGNITAKYKLTDWLTIQGRLLQDFYTFRLNERVAVGSVQESYYKERFIDMNELNSELMLMFNKQLTRDLSLSANLGGNKMRNMRQDNTSETVGGLIVPGWYNIRNSASAANSYDETFEKKINSVFASASFGYKSMLYLDLTARNDWSSTLPDDNNSYFYPSAGLGFVFSELKPLQNNKIVSFGKVRANWAQVGNDAPTYSVYDSYSFVNNFDGTPMFTLPNSKNNENLEPEISTSYEAGLEMKFLKNRIGFDVTYYTEKIKGQILPVAVDPASGFSSALLNAGDMSNRGIELLLNITPVKTRDFNWDINFNWAKNTNKVDTLYGTTNLRLASIFNGSVNATVGQPYGTIIGYAYERDDNGKIIVGEDGIPLRNNTQVALGSVLADWTAGITNTFTYKGIIASFLIDMQKGGDFYSLTNMFGNYSGLFEATVFDENGNDIRANGYVVPDAVKEDGSVNDIAADAQGYWENGYNITEQHVYDASFVKLREARLGYTFPNSLVKKAHLTDLTLSIVGRNLWIIDKNVPNIDPEVTVSSGNVQGLEGGALLPTRTIGINLSFGF